MKKENKQKHFKDERTFVIVKPDGIQRSLVGEIVRRFERIGLKLVALKMVLPSAELVEKHYTCNPDWKRSAGQKAIDNYIKKGIKPPETDPVKVGTRVLNNLKKYMTSGPVVVMVLQGAHAVGITRKLVGGTEPLSSDVGTIRGDFVLDSYEMSDLDGRSIRNLIHASGNVAEAEYEIDLWLRPEEIVKYRHLHETILYDVNLDGILE